MKKILKISGITSVIFILIGLIFRMMHFPGSSLFLIIGIVILLFLFAPSLGRVLFKKNNRR